MPFLNIYIAFLNRIILPIGDFVLGSSYQKEYRKWKKYDSFSAEALADLQQRNLLKLVKHAQQNVPFYKNKIHLDANENPVEALKKLPILTKDLLRKETENLIADAFEVHQLKKNFSSGSSGVQSYSYVEPKNVFQTQAIQRHWFAWSGFKDGCPVLQFGISPQRGFLKKLKDVFFNVHYESAFSLTETDFERIVKTISNKKIQYIIGYPSAIYELAKYLEKKEKTIAIKSIISLGDKLFAHYEKLFAKVMNQPKLIDTYGCAEGFMIACRDDLPYYYISSPHVYIEVVDGHGNAVEDGELGHILVTCLTNYAQPFLRYKLGDLGILLPKEKTPQDRKYNYPLLQKIVGRETDVIKTPAKQTLVVHSFTGVFEYFPEIKQYKIIQHQISAIQIEYIPEEGRDVENSLVRIKARLDEITKQSLQINFKKVNRIAPTASGKPQLIASTLAG